MKNQTAAFMQRMGIEIGGEGTSGKVLHYSGSRKGRAEEKHIASETTETYLESKKRSTVSGGEPWVKAEHIHKKSGPQVLQRGSFQRSQERQSASQLRSSEARSARQPNRHRLELSILMAQEKLQEAVRRQLRLGLAQIWTFALGQKSLAERRREAEEEAMRIQEEIHRTQEEVHGAEEEAHITEEEAAAKEAETAAFMSNLRSKFREALKGIEPEGVEAEEKQATPTRRSRAQRLASRKDSNPMLLGKEGSRSRDPSPGTRLVQTITREDRDNTVTTVVATTTLVTTEAPPEESEAMRSKKSEIIREEILRVMLEEQERASREREERERRRREQERIVIEEFSKTMCDQYKLLLDQRAATPKKGATASVVTEIEKYKETSARRSPAREEDELNRGFRSEQQEDSPPHETRSFRSTAGGTSRRKEMQSYQIHTYKTDVSHGQSFASRADSHREYSEGAQIQSGDVARRIAEEIATQKAEIELRERQRRDEERQRQEEERLRLEEQRRRDEDERRRQEELWRLEVERQRRDEEEIRRQEEERLKLIEEIRRHELEQLRIEEDRLKRYEEQQRLEEERLIREAEEQRLEEQRIQLELVRIRLEEERLRREQRLAEIRESQAARMIQKNWRVHQRVVREKRRIAELDAEAQLLQQRLQRDEDLWRQFMEFQKVIRIRLRLKSG
eukprot:TRINITY_DN6085_c0_g1_i4.p1 TRINITY_DN6085_c0_g1~~TRINITY_DN6085_c0_g1_i4.p1  ORF type:complete len:680 (+),score=194.62 TRINITY_DN6085_c0_g1_i4:278-2317(+)